MNPDSDDAVVGVHGFQWRFSKQDEVGYFARLNRPDLRIDLERSCIIDGGGFEDLRKGQSSLLELLHLKIAIQSRQIPIGWSGGSICRKKEVGIPGRQVGNDLAHAAEGPASNLSSTAASGMLSSKISFLNHFP